MHVDFLCRLEAGIRQMSYASLIISFILSIAFILFLFQRQQLNSTIFTIVFAVLCTFLLILKANSFGL